MIPTVKFDPSFFDVTSDFGVHAAHMDEIFGICMQTAPTGFEPAGERLPYDRQVVALFDVAHRIDMGHATAGDFLSRLMADLDGHPDPRCVGLLVFAAGLARRLAGESVVQANLYLNRFEVPQIHLFNLLGRAVPFVGMATRISNQAIMQAIAGQDRPTLIDVGIGTGRQACLLLDSLAQAGTLPQQLTVIGIEPSDWALDEARQSIEQTAKRLGADVSFFGVVGKVEEMSRSDFRRIAQACTARPVINASFALHHIADAADGGDRRDAVLAHLNTLNPTCLVLAEPDADHLEPRFFSRFVNCFNHFGAVFKTLDQLALEAADRDALKVGFFGREISDILGSPEALRSERHESAASWTSRLRRAGFGFECMNSLASDAAFKHPVVAVSSRQGYLSLDAFGVSVVALFVARPQTSASFEVAEKMEALAC